ncbi:hypothetical protein ACSTH8_00405 [Vibrio parahaemolyticus]
MPTKWDRIFNLNNKKEEAYHSQKKPTHNKKKEKEVTPKHPKHTKQRKENRKPLDSP